MEVGRSAPGREIQRREKFDEDTYALAHRRLHSSAKRNQLAWADAAAFICTYVARILTTSGYQVIAVGNGLAALAAACRGPVPELIVSDLMMPGMDEFELLQAVRADAATRDVVVIVLSARAAEEARLEGLNAGADGYMVKPSSARNLLRVLMARLHWHGKDVQPRRGSRRFWMKSVPAAAAFASGTSRQNPAAAPAPPAWRQCWRIGMT
jgi:DNA-binding response OmpR family regulator